jgi:predicted chitinase
MLTGRANYKKYGDLIEENLIDNPERAADDEISCNLACEYWDDKNLSELADQQNFREIVLRINGGYNGYSVRFEMYQRALEVVDDIINS